jgi:osmotically-inducible protein OsmY
MRLTKKGYVVITSCILILLLSGSIYLYAAFPSVRSLVNNLIGSLRSTTPTPTSTSTPSNNVPNLSDSEIKSAILQGILKNSEWRKNEIDISVTNGEVTLKGSIDDKTQSDAFEKFVSTIKGIKTIHNNLQINTSSSTPIPTATPIVQENSDERLAKEVEFACYKTDAFEIKNMKISAKDGQITISGEVRSRAEKLLAERIAKEVPGVKSVSIDLEIK